MKTIKEPKDKIVKEHKRIIPELYKAGLKKEAKIQAKELREIKRK